MNGNCSVAKNWNKSSPLAGASVSSDLSKVMKSTDTHTLI